MRFPSLTILLDRAIAVFRRFPYTIAAGIATTTFAIIASEAHGSENDWLRLCAVSALAISLTIALTLVAEVRQWSAVVRTGSLLAGLGLLALFYRTWDDFERIPDAIRFLQLAAIMHFTVAFLPFVGRGSELAFWQYNRRLFLGFLRSGVFSAVLFVGLAIALGALKKLFGLDVPADLFLHLWFVCAFVVNTWIFLAAVPEDFGALEQDEEYPKALKVFAQYILTPLVFAYLVILLAYLVKLVAGAEWPNGWIGWLVASVAVTGLLGFLLVQPLRRRDGEGWIRVYARLLFLGLIPASLMLLVAFWKRIEPYGLTEPRTLGLLLGIWLLVIAVLFSAKQDASIKSIPMSLTALFVVTLYGPISLSHLAITSQGRRFAETLPSGKEPDAKEASAALRFLVEREGYDEIARRIGKSLPAFPRERTAMYPDRRDSVARVIMAVAGSTYLNQYEQRRAEKNVFSMSRAYEIVDVRGFDWSVTVAGFDTTMVRLVGNDSVRVVSARDTNVVRVRVGADTLAFDLRPLVQRYRDSPPTSATVPDEWLRIPAEASNGRRALLSLTRVEGEKTRVTVWNGTLLLGRE